MDQGHAPPTKEAQDAKGGNPNTLESLGPRILTYYDRFSGSTRNLGALKVVRGLASDGSQASKGFLGAEKTTAP